MGLRTKMEEHVGLTVAGLLFSGFLAGIGTLTFLTDRFGISIVSGFRPSRSLIANHQVESLIADHKSRMAELQVRYMEAENEAITYNSPEGHQWWVDSAKRLGDQIEKQNEAFSSQIRALQGSLSP